MNVSADGSQSLYPSAKVEPEIGGNSAYVVATVEMTPIHELKPEPTIAILASSPQNPVPMHLQEKMGNKCCGSCCDYRRAVIIMNAIFIGIGVFFIIGSDGADDWIRDTYEDDEFVDEITLIVKEYYTKRTIFLGVALITAVIAQAGAVHFNVWMVGLHTVWVVALYISFMILAMQLNSELEAPYELADQELASPVPGFLFNGLLTALFMYPHLGFITEVRAGIMTRETYAREEFSCCCTSRR
jgi:hypothetical protein